MLCTIILMIRGFIYGQIGNALCSDREGSVLNLYIVVVVLGVLGTQNIVINADRFCIIGTDIAHSSKVIFIDQPADSTGEGGVILAKHLAGVVYFDGHSLRRDLIGSFHSTTVVTRARDRHCNRTGDIGEIVLVVVDNVVGSFRQNIVFSVRHSGSPLVLCTIILMIRGFIYGQIGNALCSDREGSVLNLYIVVVVLGVLGTQNIVINADRFCIIGTDIAHSSKVIFIDQPADSTGEGGVILAKHLAGVVYCNRYLFTKLKGNYIILIVGSNRNCLRRSIL